MKRQRWEYLSVRFSLKGRGIRKEFGVLDVNGDRIQNWFDVDHKTVSTLPELLTTVGMDGWELITHTAESRGSRGIIWHYMNFKRPTTASRKRKSKKDHSDD